ncbi:MAG: hypothetical protein KIH03_12000 [Paludibacteraceae bacterium]|nr:hypothetical protein [Paludibacteraceae bacterium]
MEGRKMEDIKINYILGGAVVEAESIHVGAILKALQDYPSCRVETIDDYQQVATIRVKFYRSHVPLDSIIEKAIKES